MIMIGQANTVKWQQRHSLPPLGSNSQSLNFSYGGMEIKSEPTSNNLTMAGSENMQAASVHLRVKVRKGNLRFTSSYTPGRVWEATLNLNQLLYATGLTRNRHEGLLQLHQVLVGCSRGAVSLWVDWNSSLFSWTLVRHHSREILEKLSTLEKKISIKFSASTSFHSLILTETP